MAISDLTVAVVQYTIVTSCFIMISARIALSWNKNKRLSTEDGWMLGALCCLVGLWYAKNGKGTNNVDHPELLSAAEIELREEGSKRALVGRPFYVSAIWCMKFCMLAVYTRIVDKSPKYKPFTNYIWVFLFATWVAAIGAILLECRPFNHYWQVYPSPAAGCKTAEIQIYIVGIGNMVTDLILIIFPIPIVFGIRIPLKQKLEYFFLFSLGFVIISMSVLRLNMVIHHGALQQYRTLFGLLELLAACFVTNGPVFYRLIVNNIRARKASRAVKGVPDLEGIQRATNDLELGGMHDSTVEVNLVAKDSATDVWEAQDYHSQECLRVN